MGLKNCVECGMICVENPSGLCPKCYIQEEEDEHKVGEYLREFGTATLKEIHEATGVKEKTILRMMKSGRVMSKGQIFYPCELCGAPINDGRLCAKCGHNIVKQVKNWQTDGNPEAKPEPAKHGMRMYSADKEDKK